MVQFLNVKPSRGLLQSGGFYMALLALQFGCQPLLVQTFVSKESSKVTIVRATEAIKILLCAAFLVAEGRETLRHIFKTWTLRESLRLSALPAACYAVQNVLAQVGYQNLDSLTYNLLNQTKTISAAVCLFLLTGKRQTFPQLIALALLLIASVMVNYPPGGMSWPSLASLSSLSSGASTPLYTGVLAVLLASFLSGLSAAVTEKVLQGMSRNSYLFSMELAIYGQVVLFLLPYATDRIIPAGLTTTTTTCTTTGSSSGSCSTSSSGGGGLWSSLFGGDDVFRGWTVWTLVPVVVNSLGGIIVGLVTKYAGGVSKGFALIAGILLTAFLQSYLTATPPAPHHWLAALLVGISTYMHATYPPGPPATPATAIAMSNSRHSSRFSFNSTRELQQAEEEDDRDEDKSTSNGTTKEGQPQPHQLSSSSSSSQNGTTTTATSTSSAAASLDKKVK